MANTRVRFKTVKFGAIVKQYQPKERERVTYRFSNGREFREPVDRQLYPQREE